MDTPDLTTDMIEFSAIFTKTEGEERRIKGFASLGNKDRSQDFVTPESFNLDRFQKNPQILYDHKFWRDETGNEVNVGRADFVSVATVADGGDVWHAVSDSGEIIGAIQKDNAPDLFPGLRGLWTDITITIDKVWEQIKSGDLNAFSWKGLAALAQVVVGKSSTVITKFIDLMEISVVHLPDNFAATFEIAKAADTGSEKSKIQAGPNLQEMFIHKVVFSAAHFTDVQAQEWLKNATFSITELSEESGVLSSLQREPGDFDQSQKFLSYSPLPGITFVVGRLTTDKNVNLELTQESPTLIVSSIEQRSTDMPKAKTKKTDTEVPETEESVKTEETVEETTGAIQETEETAETTEDTETAEETDESAEGDTEEETEENEGTGDTEKSVQDSLNQILDGKWEKLTPIFRAFSAFEEAVWESPNDNTELKSLVVELAGILSAEAGSFKALSDAVKQQSLTDSVKSAVAELLTPVVEGVTQLAALKAQPESTDSEDESEETTDVETSTDEEASEEGTGNDTGNEEEDSAESEKSEDTETAETAETAEDETLEKVKSVVTPDMARRFEFTHALATMQKQLDETTARAVAAEETVHTLAKTAVSDTPDRAETKAPDEEDPNWMFGKAWPISRGE